MTAFEQLRQPERQAPTPDRLRALAGQVPNAANANALAAIEDPRMLQSLLGQRMRAIATKIHAESQRNRTLAQEPAVAALVQALGTDRRRDIADMQSQKVEEVIAGLRMTAIGPTATVDQMMTTEFDTRDERYIESRSRFSRETGNVNISFWSVNTSNIETDRRLLTSWRDNNVQGLPPAALAGLNTLIERLNALEQADLTRLRSAEVSRQLENSMTAQGFNYMGRMTLIVGGTGLALLSGAMMYINGNFSPVIGLYAAIALAAAYPGMFFGNREQRALETAGAIFNTTSYRFFQGRLPANSFAVMTENLLNDDNRNLINSLITENPNAPLTDTQIASLVNALLPVSNQRVAPEARTQLAAAIREQPLSLRNLVNAMRPLSDNDDGRQLVIDGSRLGTPRQALIQNASQELQLNPGAGQALRQPPSSAEALG